MSERRDQAWQSEALTRTFLEGVRGGIPFAADQIDIMLRLVEGRGEPVGRFADLGCGDGILSRALLSRFPEAMGTLVDFSEPMLQAAQRKLSPGAGRLAFVRADLAEPSWMNQVESRAPFDVVVSGFAIHHLPDGRKRELYQEIYALLVPGGMFVNIDHVASLTPWLAGLADELLVDGLAAFHTRSGTGKSREQVADEFVHRPDKAANILAPVESQCEWLRTIGFQDVDCYFKAFEFAVFGGRRPR